MSIFYSSKLLDTAKKGDPVEIQKILEKNNGLLNKSDQNHQTPLFHAVVNGHQRAVEVLLAAKANVDGNDRLDKTPLWAAASRGHTAIAKLLLDAKALVDSRDGTVFKKSALWEASSKGHEKIVTILIDAKADIGKQEEKKTALWEASSKGNVTVMRLLIEARADLEMPDEVIYKPISAALAKTRHKHTRSFQSGSETPLMAAVKSKNTEAVQLLLEAKANVNATDAIKETALHKAVFTDGKSIPLLLNVRADVNANCGASTPLSRAAEDTQNAEFVELLLEAHGDVQYKSNHGNETIVQKVHSKGNPAIIQLIEDASKGIFPKKSSLAFSSLTASKKVSPKSAAVDALSPPPKKPLVESKSDDKEEGLSDLERELDKHFGSSSSNSPASSKKKASANSASVSRTQDRPLPSPKKPLVESESDDEAVEPPPPPPLEPFKKPLAESESSDEEEAAEESQVKPVEEAFKESVSMLQLLKQVPKAKASEQQSFIELLEQIEKETQELQGITTEEIQEESLQIQKQLLKESTDQKKQHDVSEKEKAELQERYDDLQQQLARKASKADQQKIQAELDTVKEQMQAVTSRVDILWNEYEIKALKRQALKKFHSHPNLILFYRTLNIRIEEIFVSYKAVAGGFVDPTAGEAATVGTVLSCLGSAAGAIPGFGGTIKEVLGWGAKAAEKVDGIRQKNRAANASSLATIAEVQKHAESIARELTECFAEQLLRIATPEEAQIQENRLQKGIKKAKEVVLKSEYIPPAKQLAVFAMVWISDQLNDASTIKGELDLALIAQVTDKAPPAKLKEFWNVVTKTLGIHGVINKNNEVWHPEEVFTLSGVKLKSPGSDDYLYYSSKTSKPEKFGWRIGSLTTVKTLGLKAVTTPTQKSNLVGEKILRSVAKATKVAQQAEEKSRERDHDLQWLKTAGRVIEGAKVNVLEEKLKESERREEEMLRRLEQMEKRFLQGQKGEDTPEEATKPKSLKGKTSSPPSSGKKRI